jgi:hypothetical protein
MATHYTSVISDSDDEKDELPQLERSQTGIPEDLTTRKFSGTENLHIPNGKYMIPREVYEFNKVVEQLEGLLLDEKKIEFLSNSESLRDEHSNLVKAFKVVYKDVPNGDLTKTRVWKCLSEIGLIWETQNTD